MRVLLVPPTFKYATNYPEFLSLSDFPSGFAYIAAALKQAGHEVFGCNPNNIVGYVDAPTMLKAVLTKRIQEVTPELIGLGGLATDFKFLKDAIGIIRGIDPKILIVLGGQIVTNDAEDIFQLLKPDYAICGEGERPIVELATLLRNEVKPWPHIWETDSGDILPIDKIPFPDYEPFGIKSLMDDFSMATRLLYRYSRPDPRPFGIVTARGCPYSCTFCIDHHRGYRARSVENVMAEIKESYEKYHFNILIILDELFAVNKEQMREFCENILIGKEKYGWDFDWMFQTHANARLDLEALQLAKKAGCMSFSYGLESASPIVLESMQKKLKVEQVVEAIKLAEEANIGFSANLIFGDVAESADTIAESLAFWFEYCKRAFVFLSQVAPYPGSALFEACRQKGMFRDKKEYYEKIDQVIPNMTTIRDGTFGGLLQLIQFLEKSWLFTKTTPIIKCEKSQEDGVLLTYQGGNYYNLTAKCPYCGQEIVYKERLLETRNFWLGTGCTHCNRKIRVEG